jgi:tRNA(Leu) C34 or U34 (ribose-2'-O)-methylase TrmL
MKNNREYGKNRKNKAGQTPSIAMVNPKYAHNVGAAIRAASCFGAHQVWYTGNRVPMDLGKKKRLPREERMKGHQDVELIQFDYFFDEFGSDVVPVAVELRKDSELLSQFDHPEKALYVFGPEDGSIPSVYVRHCHRFVVIPTRHCVNLAAAVYIMLYDRFVKRQLAGLEPVTMKEILNEFRG